MTLDEMQLRRCNRNKLLDFFRVGSKQSVLPAAVWAAATPQGTQGHQPEHQLPAPPSWLPQPAGAARGSNPHSAAAAGCLPNLQAAAARSRAL